MSIIMKCIDPIKIPLMPLSFPRWQYPVTKSGPRFAASMTRMFYCDSLMDKLRAVVELIKASM